MSTSKWPAWLRLLFIVGASTLLWGGIIWGVRSAVGAGLKAPPELRAINRRVNLAHRPKSPYPEDTADGVWDCENYAMEKRRLAGRGDVVLAMTPWRESHAVAIVDGWVLDNLLSEPMQIPRYLKLGFRLTRVPIIPDPQLPVDMGLFWKQYAAAPDPLREGEQAEVVPATGIEPVTF